MASFTEYNTLKYLVGFGNYHATEALEDALPKDQNTPQLCPYGLYAEQLTGTAFTVPRAKNQKTWFYRIRPSVLHQDMKPNHSQKTLEDFTNLAIDPNQLRWSPVPLPSSNDSIDFVEGLQLYCGAGDPSLKEGISIYTYAANKSMGKKSFYSADGDMLIVPQVGSLFIRTEMGKLQVDSCEIVVIPRGIKFSIDLTEASRGYVAELFKGHFEIPSLGPIGANGLANPRDFLVPVAAFEDDDSLHTVVIKFMNKFYSADMDHSPFDVVAWHGNYYPVKYDLRKFNTINTVSYDHLDPSIFTVLTVQTDEPGVAALDFVIFPPRWMVAEKTFRPPYYHRNCMSEFMGMIYGSYDAKTAIDGDHEGFVAGGASLHSCMTPHGPDASSFIKGSSIEELKPVYFNDGLAFMFETTYLLKVTPSALTSSVRQMEYLECWQKLPKLFTGEKNPTIDWKSLSK